MAHKTSGLYLRNSISLGLENRVADNLSRYPEFTALTLFLILNFEEIQKEIEIDKALNHIRMEVLEGNPKYSGYPIVPGRLLYKGRIVLPRHSKLIPSLLQEFHNSPMGGHSRLFKTMQQLVAEFYWPKMKHKIKDLVASCTICQLNKYMAMSPAGLFQPLPIPIKVWDDITMNFIEGLPRSEGFDTIFVVVDRLSMGISFHSNTPLLRNLLMFFSLKKLCACMVFRVLLFFTMTRCSLANFCQSCLNCRAQY